MHYIIGHFQDDLPSQSLDWLIRLLSANHLTDIDKTNHNYNKEQHKKPKQPCKKTTNMTS